MNHSTFYIGYWAVISFSNFLTSASHLCVSSRKFPTRLFIDQTLKRCITKQDKETNFSPARVTTPLCPEFPSSWNVKYCILPCPVRPDVQPRAIPRWTTVYSLHLSFGHVANILRGGCNVFCSCSSPTTSFSFVIPARDGCHGDAFKCFCLVTAEG